MHGMHTIESFLINGLLVSKFLTLRVTPPAHPVPALAPEGRNIAANMATKGSENEAKDVQNRAKMRSRGAKMEPKWSQDGPKMGSGRPKRRKKNTHLT